VAVVIGEAAVRIRGDADKGKIKSDVQPAVEDALSEAGESGADKFAEKMTAGLLGAGLAVAGGFAAALEGAALGDKLAAQLGATGGESARYGQVAGDLYAGAYGESLGDVNDAIRGVVTNIGGMADASAADLQSVTGSVMDLATAMDQDVGATSAAVGRMIQTGMAANAQEALDVITRGFQEGANRGDDFLDVIGEYGTTFTELGLQGPQAVGLINQALAAGIPNADFAADALREMGIIAREGGEEAAEALGDLGLNAEEYFSAMQQGGPAASAALDTVLDALRTTEDPAKRAAAATALIGTQYEDLGDAILAFDPSEAAGSLGTIEDAATNLGTTLNDNASTNLTSFWRTAQGAFVDLLGGKVIPVVERIASLMVSNFGPAFDTAAGIVSTNVVPPLQTLFSWLGQNETLVTALAYTVGTVLVAALTVWGARSIVSAAQNTLAWFTTAAASQVGAATQQRSALQVVVGWVLMGTQAVLQGLRIAAVWTAQIVASAVVGAASFAVQAVRVVAGWVLMATVATAQGLRIAAVWTAQMVAAAVVGAAALAVQVARVVAGWVLMGAQSLLQAGRMAAAWFIALGPVGWIIATVIGLVALIIANWDKVKTFTVNAFRAVVNAVSGAFRSVVSAVGNGISNAVNLMRSLPGRILGAIGNFGSLLYNAGASLIRGLVNGISSAAGFVGNIGSNIVNSVRGFINSRVIGPLNRGLEFTIAGITVNPPDIPTLHSGGVFVSGSPSGEGLALLRDDELVATPEQRRTADDLLRGLFDGRIPAPRGADPAGPAAGPSVKIDVHPAPGMDERVLAAHVGNDLSWQLASGATRPVALLGGTS
jgi:hypothetical protein